MSAGAGMTTEEVFDLPIMRGLGTALIRAACGRCASCGRHLKPRGPCSPGDCWLLGSRMRGRLLLRETARR